MDGQFAAGAVPAPATTATAAVAPPPDVHLDWAGRQDALWRDPAPLRGVAGVFVIWAEDLRGRQCLYIGAGRDIGTQLAARRNDPRIAWRAQSGRLTVQWAAVASLHRPGVAAGLTAALAPLFPEPAIAARALTANLPA